MSDFDAKSLCILGRQPALGLAELECLYGAEHVQPAHGAALLDVPAEDINFKRLGGTIKTTRILATLPTSNWRDVYNFLLEKVPAYVAPMEDGKFTLGVSVYGLKTTPNDINKLNLAIKKQIRPSGRAVRVVPNKDLALNSAQVLHNNLTKRGAWELILFENSSQTIVAQTLFVQDIEAYGARDQARPARDARVGMLPPKLAQIIINLAVGKLEQKTEIKDQRHRVRLLDPFCGTGVVLQEAMLMGYAVIGTDLEPRMVDYTRQNLQWLVSQQPSIDALADVEVADATTYQWPGFSCVASEVYLGRALASVPPPDKLREIQNDANTIIKKFLTNIAGQLKPGQRLCLALPAWRVAGKTTSLPLLENLGDLGYNYLDLEHAAKQDLLYFREDQVVARQLVILEKN